MAKAKKATKHFRAVQQQRADDIERFRLDLHAHEQEMFEALENYNQFGDVEVDAGEMRVIVDALRPLVASEDNGRVLSLLGAALTVAADHHALDRLTEAEDAQRDADALQETVSNSIPAR